MLPFALALVLLVAACDHGPKAVRVTIPNLEGVETPVADLVVTFLPYDRDSVIQALEAKAGARPHTKELDSLFRAFREPFNAYLKQVTRRDRLEATERQLSSQPSSPALAAVRDSLAKLRTEVDASKATLDQARAKLWPRIDSLRRLVKAWESTAYKGYDEVVRRLREKAFVNAVADTTDSGGWAKISIPDGPWWVTTRTIDPADPNGEWYWNLRMSADTVLLNPRTGVNRFRY